MNTNEETLTFGEATINEASTQNEVKEGVQEATAQVEPTVQTTEEVSTLEVKQEPVVELTQESAPTVQVSEEVPTLEVKQEPAAEVKQQTGASAAELGVPVQPTQPFYTAQQKAMPMKKPKKVGWIITLVLLILSFIGVIAGVAVGVSGVSSLVTDSGIEEMKKNQMPLEKKGASEFVVSSLEKDKMYMVIIATNAGPKVTSVKVDGSVLMQESPVESASGTETKIYSFVAKSNKVTIELGGATSKTQGNIYVIDGTQYTSKLMTAGIGFLVAGISGFVAFINFILFIIFLIIFLTRNSKYKQSLKVV